MARGGGPVSNRHGSQGEQPPAASARTESLDELEGRGKMAPAEGLEPPDLRFTNTSPIPGESYAISNPPSISLTTPNGASWADVVSFTHSHPPSGDAATDLANQAPSGNDWVAADLIAAAITAAGGDPSVLTLYIIDKDGIVRAFDYQPLSSARASLTGADGVIVPPNTSGNC